MLFNQRMSFPVELTLHTTPAGIQMRRQPIAEIASLHGDELALTNVTLRAGIDQNLAELEEANASATNLSELAPFAGNSLKIAPVQSST